MRINFIIPGCSRLPCGGYKIVFEYANRLAAKGHEIGLIFDCTDSAKKYHVPEIIRKIICYLAVYYYPKWFKLNTTIKKKCVFAIDDEKIPDGELVVATYVTTALPVSKLSLSKGNKVYLIQGYEIWSGNSSECVHNTYKLGMKNIVISSWLKGIVDQYDGGNSILIPNGINFNTYDIDIKITLRNKYSLAMLYNNAEHKGTEYGIRAILKLKQKYPKLKAHLFGVDRRPFCLPDWIEYTHNASESDLRNIYNDSAIFICPSINEGFGLTGAESMACGCVLVSSNNGGVSEYAQNGINALLSPPKDVDAMVENVITVLKNDDLRIKLAQNGYHDIKKFSWENTLRLFEKVICA